MLQAVYVQKSCMGASLSMPCKRKRWLYPVAHYAERNFLRTPYLELHSLNASAIKTYLREVAEVQLSRFASRADLIAHTMHSTPRLHGVQIVSLHDKKSQSLTDVACFLSRRRNSSKVLDMYGARRPAPSIALHQGLWLIALAYGERCTVWQLCINQSRHGTACIMNQGGFILKLRRFREGL